MMQQQLGMDLYTVMDKGSHKHVQLDDFKNKQMNLLIQAHRGEYDLLKEFPNTKIMIDSGAFGFNYIGKQASSKKLIKFLKNYLQFVKKTKDDPRIQGYFDMDIIDMGYRNILQFRKALYNITPKIIPVYHACYGIPEFKRMCMTHDKIAICSNDGIKFEGYLPMVKFAHKCGCYVHGLGFNSKKYLDTIPFNSADSAIWVTNAVRDYYFGNTNIVKTRENNKYYRPLFERKYFLQQLQKQEHYKQFWKPYFTLLHKTKI